MTCLCCGGRVSWARMERLSNHMHIVLASDIIGEVEPCGYALGADIEGEAETFLCLECADLLGRSAAGTKRAVAAKRARS